MMERRGIRQLVAGWGRILVLLLAFKAAYLLALIAAASLAPGEFNTKAQETIGEIWFPSPINSQGGPAAMLIPADLESKTWEVSNVSAPLEGKLARHFETWDAAHYLHLSRHGYSSGLESAAFYPLWPMMVRGSARLTGGNQIVAGMLLANILSALGWTIFYGIARRRFGEPIAGRALLLLMVFPGALFYQFIYSESLFFLLTMLLWRGLERGRYGVAWLAAFLLPLTRAVGVFVFLPIAWRCLTFHYPPAQEAAGQVPHGPDALRQFARRAVPRRKLPGPLIALLAGPPLGLASYFALMWHWTGNPFEGLEAQKNWGAHAIGHLWDVPRFMAGFFAPTAWHAFSGSLLDRVLFLLVVFSVPVLWRMGKDLIVWTYVLAILPAMSGTFVSLTRFESTAFTVFIALAALFARQPQTPPPAESSRLETGGPAPRFSWAALFERHGAAAGWPLPAFAGILFLIQLVLAWNFINYRWAG